MRERKANWKGDMIYYSAMIYIQLWVTEWNLKSHKHLGNEQSKKLQQRSCPTYVACFIPWLIPQLKPSLVFVMNIQSLQRVRIKGGSRFSLGQTRHEVSFGCHKNAATILKLFKNAVRTWSWVGPLVCQAEAVLCPPTPWQQHSISFPLCTIRAFSFCENDYII